MGSPLLISINIVIFDQEMENTTRRKNDQTGTQLPRYNINLFGNLLHLLQNSQSKPQ